MRAVGDLSYSPQMVFIVVDVSPRQPSKLACGLQWGHFVRVIRSNCALYTQFRKKRTYVHQSTHVCSSANARMFICQRTYVHFSHIVLDNHRRYDAITASTVSKRGNKSFILSLLYSQTPASEATSAICGCGQSSACCHPTA